MRFKATPEFITHLDTWISSLAQEEFAPRMIEQKNNRLSADWVTDAFDESGSLPIFTRLDHVANTAVHLLKHDVSDRGGKWTAADTTSVRKQVRAMFGYKDALAVYKAFYQQPSRRGLFKPADRKKIEYADVFPLIYRVSSDLGSDRAPAGREKA